MPVLLSSPSNNLVMCCRSIAILPIIVNVLTDEGRGLNEDGVCRKITKEGIENVEYLYFRRLKNGWEGEWGGKG